MNNKSDEFATIETDTRAIVRRNDGGDEYDETYSSDMWSQITLPITEQKFCKYAHNHISECDQWLSS